MTNSYTFMRDFLVNSHTFMRDFWANHHIFMRDFPQKQEFHISKAPSHIVKLVQRIY